MLRLTLDTSAILHGVLGQDYGAAVDELVDLARAGRVELSITTAFAVDQERASADRHERNLAWLSERPLIGTVPGPCRLGYSGLGTDALPGPDHAAADVKLREILLPGKAATASRREITDVQHLTAHLMAGHDAFVTSDEDDMLRKRQVIRERTGIVIIKPVEAVQLVRGRL
jgi:hypothetical protein